MEWNTMQFSDNKLNYFVLNKSAKHLEEHHENTKK